MELKKNGAYGLGSDDCVKKNNVQRITVQYICGDG